MSADSNLMCAADVPGVGTSRRLDDDGGTHFNVEFVNDGDPSTAWASKNMSTAMVSGDVLPYDVTVTVQINFRLPIEVRRQSAVIANQPMPY